MFLFSKDRTGTQHQRGSGIRWRRKGFNLRINERKLSKLQNSGAMKLHSTYSPYHKSFTHTKPYASSSWLRCLPSRSVQSFVVYHACSFSPPSICSSVVMTSPNASALPLIWTNVTVGFHPTLFLATLTSLYNSSTCSNVNPLVS